MRKYCTLLYNDEIAEKIRENIYLKQAGMRTTWRTKKKDFKCVVSDKQRLKKKIKEIWKSFERANIRDLMGIIPEKGPKSKVIWYIGR